MMLYLSTDNHWQFQSSNIPLHTGAAKPVRVCIVHGSVQFIRGKMKDEDFDEKNVSTFQFQFIDIRETQKPVSANRSLGTVQLPYN